jgi:predicted ATP-dependent endonuclease of OLD family
LPINLEWDILKFTNKLNIFIDVNKAELLFSRWIIFVEWIAEEILMPKFFVNCTGKSLDNYWISVINVNSTDFYCYVLYAESLKIPWVVITDWDITKDSEYHWITRMNNIKYNWIFNAKNFFIWFDTLEIDLAIDNLEVLNKSLSSTAWESQLKHIIWEINDDNTEYNNKNDIVFKKEYKNFFNNIGSKSDLAYNLFENIDDTFNIPRYIKESIESIISKLKNNEKVIEFENKLEEIVPDDKEIKECEEVIKDKKIEKNNKNEISIDEVPF